MTDPSDADLRRRIAERLGAKWWRWKDYMGATQIEQYMLAHPGWEPAAWPGEEWTNDAPPIGHEFFLRDYPDWPHDPGAALGLLEAWRLEKPNDRDYSVRSPWRAGGTFTVHTIQYNRTVSYGIADTLARAACRAWLAATEQEAKQ